VHLGSNHDHPLRAFPSECFAYPPLMSLRFRARILDHLSHDDYRPAEIDDLARLLRIPEADHTPFHEAVEELASQALLEIGKDDRVRLPRYGDTIDGKIKINPRGFGFVIPDTPTREGDLFIPAGQTGDAISGDRVRCRVVRKTSGGSDRRGGGVRSGGGGGGRGRGAGGSGSRPVGRVLEVIERASRNFAGTLARAGRQWLVQPDGRRFRDPILVRDPHAKGAKEGDKVVVEVISFPTELKAAEGVITEVLGEAGRPDVETEGVIAAFGLPGPFPEQVVEEARDASRSFEKHVDGPWPDRLDLTGEIAFTIDPPDARDFDDAITIAHNDAANTWTLGVHIADVASFVPTGGVLDTEAHERGNSCYLPRRVIPMLPEVLSNGVCSLQEGVARFTKSAIITLDSKGRPGHVRVANSVIRSVKRLTYIEAQAYIDGRSTDAKTHARTETEASDEVVRALRLADQLAKIIEKRRKHQGMITLALPEVELIYDDDGHVIDAVPEDNAFTHRLIEMFMVEANEAVARIFADLEVPLLRRIHPEPGFADLEELRAFARTASFRVPEEPTRQDLQALLDATRDRDDARAIHFAVLRTFSKATYSPAMIGHYALASDHYGHFTSPIRRYPDLTVHRALDVYLELTENGTEVPGGRRRRSLAQTMHDDPRIHNEATLLEIGGHCSETEVRAEEAERDLRNFLVLQLLHEKHMGDEFDAIVTGVLGSSAVFVSLEKYLIDGVVRLDAMPISRESGASGGADGASGSGASKADDSAVSKSSGSKTTAGSSSAGDSAVSKSSANATAAGARPLRERWRGGEDTGGANDRGGGGSERVDRAARSGARERGSRTDRSERERNPERRPERWTVNERDGRLVAVRSGASIGLGDRVRVGIISIDLASRTLELALAAPLALRGKRALEGDDEGTGEAADAGSESGESGGGSSTSSGQRGPKTRERGSGGDTKPGGAPGRRDGNRGIGLGKDRDPRRDLLSREQRSEVKGHRRGFKQGRRGRRTK